MDSVRNNIERPFVAIILKQAGIALVMALIFLTLGCSKDEKTYNRDETIPENVSWDINTVLDTPSFNRLISFFSGCLAAIKTEHPETGIINTAANTAESRKFLKLIIS
ncbi:MAG: hypothetical protein Q7T35_08285, partial [Nitrosomonas sp.]|nr:hypothetical protein [Nitrosomonas sp.]